MHWGIAMSDDFDAELDDLFQTARRQTQALPDGLAQRILADAHAQQSTPAQGIWPRMRDALGGWPGLGGLVAAGMAGVWLGFAPPDVMPDPIQLVGLSDTGLDLFEVDGWADVLGEEG